jgi:hypothetical protein
VQATTKYKEQTSGDEWSLKQKIGYSFLTALGVTALGFGITQLVKKGIAKSSDKKSFKAGTPATMATQIGMAFENKGRAGVDIEALRQVMTSIRSDEELQSIRKEYLKQYHTELNNDMKLKLQTNEYNEMLQIMESKPAKPGQAFTAKQLEAFAKRFKAAFSKTTWGFPDTDEEAIRAIMLELPTQKSFLFVAAIYEKLYGKKLLDELKSELLSYELAEFYETYNRKPKA